MASTYLTRTPSSTSSTTITTHSLWFKRSELANDFLYINFENGTNYGYIGFDSDSLDVRSSPGYVYVSTQKLRDPSAWYHLVVAVDNSLGTASDRVKIYLNGSRITSFSTQTDPSSGAVNNLSVDNTTSNLMNVGGYSGGNHFGGSISHFHFIDGTAYDASAFGETDANGVWKIKTSPSVTYGNNGFFILKDGNSVTDQSGNGNNFTVGGGTLTNTEDSPSNVFATVNSLDSFYQNTTLSEGNLKIAFNDGYAFNSGTLGFNSGKYYWEVRSNNWSAGNQSYGITSAVADASNDEYYNNSGSGRGYGLYNNGVVYGNGTLGTGYTSSGYGYIGMIAVDADNDKIYFGANGSWENSANPTAGTGGISIVSASTQNSGFWFPAFSGGANSSGNDFKINFGNGYFGTTAVASAGTNASGIGIFEYDVPTGYTALSTKGLNL